MGHRLRNYNGICSSPHGHNVRIVAEVEVSEGVFFDFKKLDSALAELSEQFDHAMVLSVEDVDLIEALEAFEFRLVVLDNEPSTENLAAFFFWGLVECYNFRVNAVTVHETDKYSATVSADYAVSRVQLASGGWK